ncbi:helix-turn-helix domain-containing protein [Planctobacterium marinum]|uniref:HTH araC/xylS-type domain-containing protein n=1 Tax=Planctobacterium marinum TaxID=1631968 RepID=A0AA48HJZ8_9ALTE|nr:hypothetical protein MACH26_16670 [Planctobacterium marinum]
MAVSVAPTVIYSCMLGIVLFALLENTNKARKRQTVYLQALLTFLLVHILGELYIYSGFYQYAPALAGLQFPVRMLLGPALYLYAFATMSPEKKPARKTYFFALSGPLVVILVMLPFLFGITSEEKLALADPATRDPVLWQIAVYTCLTTMLVFVLFTGIYFWLTLRLHTQHRLQLMERYSSIEKRSMDWFKVVLLLWGAAWLMFATEYSLSFFGYKWAGSGIAIPLIEAVILLFFAHYAVRQPVLSETEKGKASNKANRKPQLQSERMQEIAAALKSVMLHEQLFMEEDLSLKKLSEAISVSENHISETLSQFINTNFFHFVNGYRIEAAKQLLSESEKQVTQIAFEVGFNSKSTFNTAFKKSTGLTPSAFRNAQ